MDIVLFSPLRLFLLKELHSRTIIFFIHIFVCWSTGILYNYIFISLKSLVFTYSYERKNKEQKKKKFDLSRQAWISPLRISIDSTSGNHIEASYICILSWSRWAFNSKLFIQYTISLSSLFLNKSLYSLYCSFS